MICISFLLAAPLGYFFMQKWINGFEYRVNLGITACAAAAVFTLVIGAVTTGLRSLKAATSNPVDSLRSE